MEVENGLEKLVKLYKNNKLSHVYLIETNNIDLAFFDLLEVIKKIVCPGEYKKECSDCNLCNLIEQRTLPSLIVIEPDGKNIKKEQVLDLKKRFSSIPMFTNNNIYILKNADKLNNSSANTILKFVEEPNDAVLGFLLATNINNVIPTIKSRCEILSLMYDEDTINNLDLYKDVILEYLQKIELEKTDYIMYNKSVILDKFSERSDIEKIFKEILNIYEAKYDDLLSAKIDNDEFSFLNKLSVDELQIRLKLLSDLLNDINTNVNIELLLDKFIIELSGEYD